MEKNESWKNVSKTSENKASYTKLDLEVCMSFFGKLFQKLWEVTLASNLYAKDKAEILRMLIFAFIIIVQTALFIWALALLL